MEKIRYILFQIRFLPVGFAVNWNDTRLKEDLERWKSVLHLQTGSLYSTAAVLLGMKKEFRNLFLYRNRNRMFFKRWAAIFYKPMESLFIEAEEIGGGLFIQHGFATMISAKTIGKNCWINQQVTIGYRGNSPVPPVLGDSVTVTCGAKVLGNITLGDGCTIGANAVVIHDVEPGVVMAGVPARKIH